MGAVSGCVHNFTIDALFFGRPRTIPLRTWARHLVEVRERTVFETHVERYAAGFTYLPPRTAVTRFGKVLVEEVRPLEGETWLEKLKRSRTAAANAGLPATTRERGIGKTTRIADAAPHDDAPHDTQD